MQPSEVLESLQGYVADEILDGQDIGLDSSTPLLEWGVLNSIEMVRLISFIESRFKVEVPNHKVVPEYFKDLSALSNLILEIAKGVG